MIEKELLDLIEKRLNRGNQVFLVRKGEYWWILWSKDILKEFPWSRIIGQTLV